MKNISKNPDAKIFEKISDFYHQYGEAETMRRLDISRHILKDFLSRKRKIYPIGIITQLYEYFWLERDEFFEKNYKTLHTQHESVLGEFFRKKRLENKLLVTEAARATKLSERTILRLEAGQCLPSFSGYTIVTLLDYYRCTPEESECVRWYIVILSDLIRITKSS